MVEMNTRGPYLQIAFLYAALFLALGVMLPFLPVWLSAKGLSIEQIAIILAVHSAVRIVAAPVITYLADRFDSQKAALVFTSIATFAGFGLSGVQSGFPGLLLTITFASIAFAPSIALAEAFSVTRARQFGMDYGRLRLWGSLSFIAGSIGSGLAISRIPKDQTIWFIVLALGLLIAATITLPPHRPNAAPQDQRSALQLSSAVRLIVSSHFVVLVLAAGLAQASHALFYGFGSVHWQSLGYTTETIGVLWAIGVGAEVVLFAVAGKRVSGVLPATLILLGAGAGAARWVGMSLDPAIALVVVLQVLHALSFGLVHLGTMFHIREYVPQSLAGTAQGVYAAVSGGIIMSALTFVCGPAYREFAGQAYLLMAAVSLVAALLGLWLVKVSPRVHSAQDASSRPQT